MFEKHLDLYFFLFWEDSNSDSLSLNPWFPTRPHNGLLTVNLLHLTLLRWPQILFRICWSLHVSNVRRYLTNRYRFEDDCISRLKWDTLCVSFTSIHVCASMATENGNLVKGRGKKKQKNPGTVESDNWIRPNWTALTSPLPRLSSKGSFVAQLTFSFLFQRTRGPPSQSTFAETRNFPCRAWTSSSRPVAELTSLIGERGSYISANRAHSPGNFLDNSEVDTTRAGDTRCWKTLSGFDQSLSLVILPLLPSFARLLPDMYTVERKVYPLTSNEGHFFFFFFFFLHCIQGKTFPRNHGSPNKFSWKMATKLTTACVPTATFLDARMSIFRMISS